MTPREHVRIIIKELDAQREDLAKFAKLDEDTIKSKFHDTVTNALKSIVARADYMEAAQKGLA